MRKFSKKQKELLLTPELRMISPDGLMIEVHWDQADVGSSYFIPCINTKKARKQLNRIAAKIGFKLLIRLVIEDGCMGLRVWTIEC